MAACGGLACARRLCVRVSFKFQRIYCNELFMLIRETCAGTHTNTHNNAAPALSVTPPSLPEHYQQSKHAHTHPKNTRVGEFCVCVCAHWNFPDNTVPHNLAYCFYSSDDVDSVSPARVVRADDDATHGDDKAGAFAPNAFGKVFALCP